MCNFSDIEDEEDIDVIEEIFISINEEVDRGIKQEEIPGDITFADRKSELEEVSYVCICGSVIGHILPLSRNLVFFFVMSVFPDKLKQVLCRE